MLSIFRRGQPRCLSVWWDFCYTVWFRVVFSFSWFFFFNFFFFCMFDGVRFQNSQVFVYFLFSKVSWWEFMLDLDFLWVQLKIIFKDSLQLCMWKTMFFWNVFVEGDFFRLLQTESPTASALSGHLTVNYLPDLGFSAFSLRLFINPVAWNLCTQRHIWLLCG